MAGDDGKPRPALVIQSGYFDWHPSVTVLPVTSHLRETPLFRVMVATHGDNNLRVPSQVMVDKAVSVARERVGTVFGSLKAEVMLEVNRSLAPFLGIAK